MHGLRRVGGKIGALAWLERRAPRSRTARWARSLFAIYDFDDMVRLDLPWWTFEAIARVDAFLARRPEARVLEYGGGASTVWLSRRAGHVTTVEHDPEWLPLLRERLAGRGNVTLLERQPDAAPDPDPAYRSEKRGWAGRTFRGYVHAVDALDGSFDLIVIDGRARPACLAHAASRLKPDGLIVFDNSHRPAYRRAIAASPFRAERTRGLTACLPYPDETTLLWPR